MKTLKLFSLILALGMFIFTSCEDNLEPEKNSILPEKFSVDIPSALSRDGKKSSVAIDTLNGNQVYAHLVNFIRIGEGGAEIVEGIINGIRRYRIDKPLILTYRSDEDGRSKNITVTEKVLFEGVLWEYELLMTDADSEGNEDGGKGMQIFWNRSPKKGISILKPYNIDRNKNHGADSAMFRIDYSEAGEFSYDAHMIIAVSGLPVEHPLSDPFSVSSLKMFVGKKGDVVDIYGNSNHPNASFFTPATGFNWAFVASGDDDKNIGVAEVGLPPSSLNTTSRQVILKDYSIKSVFSSKIYELWPNIDEESVEAYLYNTEAPGFFDDHGFIRGGTSPRADFDPLVSRLSSLSPYNPLTISNLEIEFGE